jgi:outer membrane receptor protein involved in Fe transport
MTRGYDMNHVFFHQCQRTAIVLALAAAFHPQAQAQAQSEMQVIEIIGSTPLPGIGQARSEIAAPVQRATSRDIERSGALELGEFMNRRLGSVHVNEIQGNPFQMDVNYRGYTASPLLGTPQGLSVYLDGVRMNQPFGDVVSWDLIPRAAIATMTLMPGSNPLFGLSTLGAALSLQTKDGKNNPGTALQTTLGSNGRRAVEFEHGDYNDAGLNWYLTGNRFQEDGWRDASPSNVRQLFGKLGWQNRDTDLKLTLAHADNDLTGNGLQEQGLLARNRASVYTLPDQTQNRSTLLNLAASHAFSNAVQLSGNLYYRDIRTSTYNGDINDDALSSNVYLPGENAANTPFPSASCIAQALDKDEPAEVCNGLINRTHSKQQNYGISSQLTWMDQVAGKPNRLVIGAGVDASRVNFTQSSQLGYLNLDRSISGVNAFGDGTTDADGAPYDTRVDLNGKIQTWSVFASDTISLQPNLHLTLSGRYNRSTIKNRDQLHLDTDAATLSGDHRFTRFNPAIGLSYSPAQALNLYAGYNESSRAPTSIELGCANPDQPCKLPNAMAGDPPLNQVVARTLEAGLRGTAAPGVQWNAGLFRSENSDDILFVADNQAGFGYFKNFGKTRRQGLELGASSKLGQLNLGAQYTWLDASYQSAETVNGSSNSSNSSNSGSNNASGQDGTIQIRAGDKIPLIPHQMLKLFADYAVSGDVMLHGSMVAVSNSLARGNENNGHQPDGQYYLGSGHNPGHAIFNLGASWRMTPQWQWQAQVNNLFDTRYSTAAQLGAAGFDGRGNFQAQPFGAGGALQHSTFYAPGAPRQIQVTLRYSFDRPGA